MGKGTKAVALYTILWRWTWSKMNILKCNAIPTLNNFKLHSSALLVLTDWITLTTSFHLFHQVDLSGKESGWGAVQVQLWIHVMWLQQKNAVTIQLTGCTKLNKIYELIRNNSAASRFNLFFLLSNIISHKKILILVLVVHRLEWIQPQQEYRISGFVDFVHRVEF
jgi:hypothetical protein